jgi:hypothetical protein
MNSPEKLKKSTFNDLISDRVHKYLDHCPGAVSGQRGHDQTFKVAVVLVWGFCLPREDALQYLRQYNLRCSPPWTDAELAHKILSAIETCNSRWLAGLESRPPGYLRCYWKGRSE